MWNTKRNEFIWHFMVLCVTNNRTSNTLISKYERKHKERNEWTKQISSNNQSIHANNTNFTQLIKSGRSIMNNNNWNCSPSSSVVKLSVKWDIGLFALHFKSNSKVNYGIPKVVVFQFKELSICCNQKISLPTTTLHQNSRLFHSLEWNNFYRTKKH